MLAGLGVLAVGLLAVGYLTLAKVPRPSLPYPAGHELVSVRGNCASGFELLGCDSRNGPRSFLTIRAGGDQRAEVERLFANLRRHGWVEEAVGMTAQDFDGGGAPEDIQPLYCSDGCVGLFRFAPEGYTLAWFER